MQEQFLDRILKCVDCNTDFIFTAGEQLFFFDKQFKNDPKRCKPCKGRRSGLAAVANGTGLPAAGLSRTETRTMCSDCGIETTVPFKPTQGRPVLCRQCFGQRGTVKPGVQIPGMPIPNLGIPAMTMQAATLSELSVEPSGMMLSHDAAILASASIVGAHANSSVATKADLATVAAMEGLTDATEVPTTPAAQTQDLITHTPAELLHPQDISIAELLAAEPAQA